MNRHTRCDFRLAREPVRHGAKRKARNGNRTTKEIMIHLTHGINLSLNPLSGRLERLAPVSGLLDRLPLRLWVTLEGETDPDSGLLMNVRDIKAVFVQAVTENPPKVKTAPEVFRWARHLIEHQLREFQPVMLRLDIKDTMTLSWNQGTPDMIELTTQYTLAASHRLWNPAWSEAQNLEAYGKCSNPRGHGHNYQVKVTLRGKPDPDTGQIMDPTQRDEIIRRELIEPFDHKHFNEDTPEFAELVPTVENIARVFWNRLDGKFHPAELARVAVWETETTYAEYFGPHVGPLRYSDSV